MAPASIAPKVGEARQACCRDRARWPANT